jgi:hypothetical protein
MRKKILPPSHVNRNSTCTVRFRLNTWYRKYLIPVPKYCTLRQIDQPGLHLFTHRSGGLLLGGRLVGKTSFFCAKKHDQVGGCGKVSVTLALHAHYTYQLDETLHSVPHAHFAQMPLGTTYLPSQFGRSGKRN